MTETPDRRAEGRSRRLDLVHHELLTFERKEAEFRRKDRSERAAELRLPFDKLEVHCAVDSISQRFKKREVASDIP